jgi:hypothetical protein
LTDTGYCFPSDATKLYPVIRARANVIKLFTAVSYEFS